jgi:type I site-specific restriction endonuclease
MAHQIETAAFMTLNRRSFCFNDPGTGKTLSALWAADFLMNKGEVRRVLDTMPLVHHAQRMDGRHQPKHHSQKCRGRAPSTSRRRIEMIQQDYEFVIANYDGLNLIASEINQ